MKLRINKLLICLLISLFSNHSIFAIEGLSTSENYIYFIDSSIIYKYKSSDFGFIQKKDIADDQELIAAITAYAVKTIDPGITKDRVWKRLKSARFFNVTHYNNKIYVSVSLLRLDNVKQGWSYLIAEYTPEFAYSSFYLLADQRRPQYGYAEHYAKFKIHFHQNDVIFTLTDPPALQNKVDSEANFAIFSFNKKQNEIRFKKLIVTPKINPAIKRIHYYKYPFCRISYPINVPFIFSTDPAYFSFPFLITRNLNEQALTDPYKHLQYAIDSAERLMDLNYKNVPYNTLFNGLKIRQLPLCYDFHSDTLCFLVNNYSKKNELQLIKMFKSGYTTQKVKSTFSNPAVFFFFLNGRPMIILKINNEFIFDYID